jgi:hypothetical protein
VVERPVFLDQENNVLDFLDSLAGRRICCERDGGGDWAGVMTGGEGAQHQAQKDGNPREEAIDFHREFDPDSFLES